MVARESCLESIVLFVLGNEGSLLLAAIVDLMGMKRGPEVGTWKPNFFETISAMILKSYLQPSMIEGGAGADWTPSSG